MALLEFACPGCGLNVQINKLTRGMRHQEPASDCQLWVKLADDRQEYLRLAFLAQQGIPSPLPRLGARAPEAIKGAAALRLKD